MDRVHVRIGEFGIEPSSDGLTIEGYATVYNQPAMITDWLGEYEETMRFGAFARSLTERGPAKVKMQFDHGHDTMMGSMPIGVWQDIREDSHGLYARGRLLDSWHTIPVRAAIEAGAVSGMSIRMKVIGEEWSKSQENRSITEAALFEAGPVVWPAYAGTEVGVRALALDMWRSRLGVTLRAETWTPPQGVREEARRALEWIEEGHAGDGFTDVGRKRASDLARGAAVSEETLRRMRSFFARHEVDKQGEGWSPGEDGYPSPGRVAWAAWGGDAGRSWANSILEGLDRSVDAPGDVVDAVILSTVDPEETETVTSETANRAVADTPVGATRRDLQRLALPILLGDTNNAS